MTLYPASIPSMAPGYVQLMGQLSKGTGNTINLVDGDINMHQ